MKNANQANTSIHIEPKLKLKAQMYGIQNRKSLTQIINEAIKLYLKSN